MKQGEWRQALDLWHLTATFTLEHVHAYAKTCEVLQEWGEHEALLADACVSYPEDETLLARQHYRAAIANLRQQKWQAAAEQLDALAQAPRPAVWPFALRYYRREADIGTLLQGVIEPQRVLEVLCQRQLFKHTRPYRSEQLAGIERVVEALPWTAAFKAAFMERLGELIAFVRSRDEEPLIIQDAHFEQLVARLATFLREYQEWVQGLPAIYCAYFCRLLMMFGHIDLYYLFRNRFIAMMEKAPAPTRLVDYAFQLGLANERGAKSQARCLREGMRPLLASVPEHALLGLSELYFGAFSGKTPDGLNDAVFARYLEDKSVAIVGPVEVGLDNGEEIDGFDVVVRLNYQHAFAYEQRYFGSKTNCSYYLTITETPQLQATLPDLDFVMFEVGEQFLPPSVQARKRLKAWHYLISPFLLDMPNSIQQVLMDVLRFSPGRVKVFNSNLYMSLDYAKGYFAKCYQTDELVLSRPLSVHDPVSNFLFMQRLFIRGAIEADCVLARVLEMSEVEYVRALNRSYGQQPEALIASSGAVS